MARRSANGEGSIYKRQDGRWEAAISLDTVAGRRKRVRFYGRTRQEVHGKLTAAKAQAGRGISLPDHQWRVNKYLDYWLTEIVKPKRRPKTYQQYESVSRLYLKPTLGDISLTKLSVRRVQAFINDQFAQAEAQGHSRRKVHTMRAVLSAALSRAMREELVTRNVAQLVEMEPDLRKRIDPWTADEAIRFLDSARSSQLYPAYMLLILLGLRRGELLGLRWQDIDFTADVIHIRQQLQRVGRNLVFGPVKTTAGDRQLPLLPRFRELLLNLWNEQEGLIFTNKDGSPIRPERFYRTFLRLCEAAGVRSIKIHHVRHTTATLLKKLGTPDRDIQQILGHSHVSVTQEIYQHADLEDRRVALDRLSESLNLGEDRVYCRQICRQAPVPLFATRKGEHFRARLSGISSGAGRGSRTPEDIKSSDLQFDPSRRENQWTSVTKIARRGARVWILGCIAVNFAVNLQAENAERRAA
jgi:integrase